MMSVPQAQRLAIGLRSFLGFALVEGLIGVPLTGAVPSVARWSGAALPRGLTPKQVSALLASCYRPVRPVQLEPTNLAAQHRNLTPQHQDLGVP